MGKNRERTEAPGMGDEVAAEIDGADPPRILTRFTGYLLRRVFAQFNADTSSPGTDLRDLSVMEALAEKDWASQLDLAEALGINRTTMVTLLSRMEEGGQVARNRNPKNRRTYVLSLTESGRAALTDMRDAALKRDLDLTARLSGAERDRLRDLLATLVTAARQGRTADGIEALVAQAHQHYFKLGSNLLAGSGLQIRFLAPLSALTALAPCAQQELAQFLGIAEPAAAELVDDMVQAGFVQRGRDASDRRRYALEATESGRRALAALLDAAERQEADSLSSLGPAGSRELRNLLLKVLGLADAA